MGRFKKLVSKFLTQEKQQEKLEELEKEKNGIEFEIESSQERLDDTQAQLEQMKQVLEEGEVAEII